MLKHPLSASDLKSELLWKVRSLSNSHQGPASHNQMIKLTIMMEDALKEVSEKQVSQRRRSALKYLVGSTSIKKLSNAEASALIGYAVNEQNHARLTGESYFGIELESCVKQRLVDLGQMSLF